MKITINQWPQSQMCMDCKFGLFICAYSEDIVTIQDEVGELIGPSAYICRKDVETDGLTCDDKEEEQ